jgi:excisionase family DNA binding protein
MPVAERTSAVSLSEAEPKDVLNLYTKIRSAEARLVGPDGEAQRLAPDLRSFLGQLLGDLEAGRPVTILQADAALTTVKAAKMLGVSRQFLVQLLESDQMPFHMVGTHRRVYARDVLAFKARRDSARRRILDDLTRAETDDGLYDRVPLDGAFARQPIIRYGDCEDSSTLRSRNLAGICLPRSLAS